MLVRILIRQKRPVAGSLVSDDQSGWPAGLQAHFTRKPELQAVCSSIRRGTRTLWRLTKCFRLSGRLGEAHSRAALYTLCIPYQIPSTLRNLRKRINALFASERSRNFIEGGASWRETGGFGLTAVSVLQGWQTGGWRVNTLSLDSVGW